MSEFYRNYLAVVVFVGAALSAVGAMLGGASDSAGLAPTREVRLLRSGSDAIPGFGQSNVRYYVHKLLFVMFDVEAVFVSRGRYAPRPRRSAPSR